MSPTPRTVWIAWGFSGSISTLRRSRVTRRSMARSNASASRCAVTFNSQSRIMTGTGSRQRSSTDRTRLQSRAPQCRRRGRSARAARVRERAWRCGRARALSRRPDGTPQYALDPSVYRVPSGPRCVVLCLSAVNTPNTVSSTLQRAWTTCARRIPGARYGLAAAYPGSSIHHVADGSRWDLALRGPPRDPLSLGARSAGDPSIETVEVEKDDRRRVKRQRLADDQPADDRIAERLADFRAGAGAEHQRNAAEQCRHRRHHYRPEP